MNLILAMMFVISTVYADEHRRKLVVIDSGIGWHQEGAPFLCKDGAQSVVTGTVYDNHGHGTNLISIISKKMDHTKWCIVSIKYFEPNIKSNMFDYLKALKLTTSMTNVGIVNLSIEGSSSDITEEFYLRTLINNKTIVVTAAGNDNFDLNKLCNVWPACYKLKFKTSNFKVVAGTDFNRTNKGSIVTNWRPANKQGFPKLSGTSQATAIYSSELSQ